MKIPPPTISLVGFKTTEEVASYLDEVPDARFELSYKMSRAFLEELSPLIEGRVESAHACCPAEPIFPNFASSDPSVLSESFEAVEHTLETCARFGATIMVLHPGYVTDLAIPAENNARQALLDDPVFKPYIGVRDGAICRTDYPESDVYRRHRDQASRELAKVAALASSYGVRLAAENLNPRVAYLFQKPEEMVALSESCDALSICLDVGHLYIASAVYGFDYLEGLKTILATGRVINCHLHANTTDKGQGRFRDDHHTIDRHGFPIEETLCLVLKAKANLVLETVEEPVYNSRRLIELLEVCHAGH